MKRKSFYGLIFSMLLVFAFIASQGCGGSSSNSFNRGSDSDDGETTGSVVIGGETILKNYNLDTDGNGKPDFLDFDSVAITHVKASSTPSSITVQPPVIIFFEELKKVDVGEPDTVHVNLQAGTEYTVEFSKNFADSAASLLPLIEIFSPLSDEPMQYYFDEDEDEEDDESGVSLPADMIQLSVYPQEEPSLICMTFTPSVTGEYVIRLSSQIRPESESDDVSVSASEDTSCVLFIYKELRNENGEPGYYTRFKFADDSGNTTDTLDICDIIEMRKLYLSFDPDYLTRHYGEPSSDTPAYEELTEEQLDELFEWIYMMQYHQGLDYYDEYIEASSASTVRPSANLKAKKKTQQKKTDLKSNRTGIDTTVSGIRYDATYGLGNGFFGITGYPAIGHAINSFKLPVPKNRAAASISSYYKADFISSQQEQENFSNTRAGIGFSKGGFGLSASLSHMSSYKFGITSTTFVIHYDELEATPRQLDISKYALTDAAKKQLAKGSNNFRNLYGDYFVAGYTYGGTYDAYISITTETVEQLKEIKSQLRAQFQTVSLDAKVANTTKEILNKYNASVSIEIRTSGTSASSPNPKIITPLHGKNNVESVNDVISELMNFRNRLAKQNPANFAPVNVILQRYSLLAPVLSQMVKDKQDGTIPLAPNTSVIIQNFNRSLRTLGAYYQVIGGLDDSKIDAEVRDDYYSKYMDLYNTVRTDPKFYDNSQKVDATKKAITNLSRQLKATGDRYVFYKMLIAAQSRERAKYNEHRGYEENAGSDYVKKQPFGAVGGGSIGYSEFSVSTAVTQDIKEGKRERLNGVQSYKPAGWRYWGTSSHNLEKVSASYDAKTAKGKTDAAFCYVLVETENVDTDRHRRFQNTPVVGKSRLDFDFTSGYSRWATWTVTYQTFKFSKATYPFFGLDR
ncbi:MAG: hypothetical protein II884_08520 [Synergistaceae bacterium]|nr:hypothetical protein [Synergistaceae bacterium]